MDSGYSFALTGDQRNVVRPLDDPALPNAIGGDGSDIGAYEKDSTQSGSTYEVNTTGDHNDGSCTLADCTLREAILATNAHSGADVINFKSVLSGTITLRPALGQLSVSGPTTMNGPGARLLGINGNNALRLFSFSGGSSSISGLTLRNGVFL